MNCEQCGAEVTELDCEVCDECCGIFCNMHINLLEDDSVLCDTCALEREREDGNAGTDLLGDSR